jgi:hypothetical protein
MENETLTPIERTFSDFSLEAVAEHDEHIGREGTPEEHRQYIIGAFLYQFVVAAQDGTTETVMNVMEDISAGYRNFVDVIGAQMNPGPVANDPTIEVVERPGIYTGEKERLQ